jgi:hypothetical protein
MQLKYASKTVKKKVSKRNFGKLGLYKERSSQLLGAAHVAALAVGSFLSKVCFHGDQHSTFCCFARAL